MLTRADTVRAIINDDGYYYTKHSVLEIVHYIFDEHERKIIHLKHIENEVILLRDRKKELEIQLKAKDEEIKNLNCRVYHAEGYISDLHNHPKGKKFYDAKARSIVAMLFWRAKRQKSFSKILQRIWS